MPLLGNQAGAHPMAPATQSSITDATCTFTGNAALSGVYPGAVVFSTTGDSIQLTRALLNGSSTVSIAGQNLGFTEGSPPDVQEPLFGENAFVTVTTITSGYQTVVDAFYWRTGEPVIYETYRLTGEYVWVSVTATQTLAMVFNINLFVSSV